MNGQPTGQPTRVTLTEPGVAGSYVVEEQEADGSLLLRPDTSARAIRERLGTRPMTEEEFQEHFGDLPTDVGGRPATREEFEREYGHLPTDGEG